jgi:hypothetical protein
MGSPGKDTKKLTHSIERARKRQELHNLGQEDAD